MDHKIAGLHHVRAITSSVQRNYDFYAKFMGLRLVKKTVNVDDPAAYHLYYGNETGDPGTLLSVLAWENIGSGYVGAGIASDVSFSIPDGSLGTWINRLQRSNTKYEHRSGIFGEECLYCIDPDGLLFNLVITGREDARQGWQSAAIPVSMAIKGLHSVSLAVTNTEKTAQTLTNILGYTLSEQQGNKSRFITTAAANANTIDLVQMPDGPAGYVAGGTIHHIAFRVNNNEALAFFRERILSLGLRITPKSDVAYFSSFYFREPGGALFELASDEPGLTMDEPAESLGSNLILPARFEHMRDKLSSSLITR